MGIYDRILPLLSQTANSLIREWDTEYLVLGIGLKYVARLEVSEAALLAKPEAKCILY